MSLQINAINSRVGKCPHGLPTGACPVCSGGGAVGGPSRPNERRKAGEMTWAECYAMGKMMQNAKLEKELAQKEQLQNIINMQNTLVKSLNKFINAIEQSMPHVIKNAINLANNRVLQPLIRTVQNLANNLSGMLQNININAKQIMQNIKHAFVDISDKLAAIFGEMKNAIEKNISDNFKKMTKKIFSLFNILGVKSEEDEDDERTHLVEKEVEVSAKLLKNDTREREEEVVDAD